MKDDETIAEYTRYEDARSKSGPGDVIVPIVDNCEVHDFLTGEARLPVFNRSGLRD